MEPHTEPFNPKFKGELEEEGELPVASTPQMASSMSSVGADFTYTYVEDDVAVPLPEDF